MADNIVPKGNVVEPRKKTFRNLGITATFTKQNLYVEELFRGKRLKNTMLTRNIITVRSQKTTTGVERYYFVHLTDILGHVNVRKIEQYFNFCTCRDLYTKCKHMWAVQFSFQGHTINLR